MQSQSSSAVAVAAGEAMATAAALGAPATLAPGMDMAPPPPLIARTTTSSSGSTPLPEASVAPRVGDGARGSSSGLPPTAADESSSDGEPGGPGEEDEYEDDQGFPTNAGDMIGSSIGFPRKKKRRLTEEQIHHLSIARDQKGVTGKKLHMQARLSVAADIGLPESAVRNWLNNHKRKRGNANSRGQQQQQYHQAVASAAAAAASMGPPPFQPFPMAMQMSGAMSMDNWPMPNMLTTPSQPSNLTNFFLSHPNQFAPPPPPAFTQQQSTPQQQAAAGVQYGGSYQMIQGQLDLQQQQQQQMLHHQQQLQSYASEWPPSYSPQYSSVAASQNMSAGIPNTFELERPMAMTMAFSTHQQQQQQQHQQHQQQQHHRPAQSLVSSHPLPLSSSPSDQSFDPSLIPLLQKKLLERHATHTAAFTKQQQASQAHQNQEEILQKIEAITRYNLSAAKAEEPAASTTIEEGPGAPLGTDATIGGDTNYLAASDTSFPIPLSPAGPDAAPATLIDGGAPAVAASPSGGGDNAELCDSLRAQIRSLQAKLNEVFQKQQASEQGTTAGVKREPVAAPPVVASSGAAADALGPVYQQQNQIQFQHPAHPAYGHYSQPGLLTSNALLFLGQMPIAHLPPPPTAQPLLPIQSGVGPSPMASFLRVPSGQPEVHSGRNSRRNSNGNAVDPWSGLRSIHSPGMAAAPDDGELLFDKALLEGFYEADRVQQALFDSSHSMPSFQ